MSLRSICIAIALFTALALASGAYAADENLKQLSGNGITVMYPAGMETQAKKVMSIAQESIKPSIEIQRNIVALLSDVDSMSSDIAQMLGADEKQEIVKARLQSFKDKALALSTAFAKIKLIKKSDAAAANGVDAGIVQIRYVKDKDEFTLMLDDSDCSADKIKRSFFPVLINGDGSIRSEAKVAQMALDFLGVGEGIAIGPVHDTIGYVIAEPLKIYHPLARWFNEGVSGWMTRQIVSKYSSKLSSVANNALSLNATSKNLRDKVNLLAWPQSAFENRSQAFFDPALAAANSQYAIELMSNLLGKTGPQVLPKIMDQIKYVGNPDTDTICAAIKKVTGADFKATLMTYVPQDIREGMASGESNKLVSKAEAFVGQKKWQDAVDALRRSLQIAPDDVNARLNLAWIEREVKERQDSEIQVFLTAALLKQQKYSFHMFAPSIEGNYVMGRLAILMGDLGSAKKFLEPVIEYAPDHQDAKKALEEIRKLEGAAKE